MRNGCIFLTLNVINVIKITFKKIFFRQGRLQFKPPFEEVRARYYREMKRFISIPNQFKGVSETDEECIFSVMTERNASGFLTTFSKAEDLFRRLAEVLDQFKVCKYLLLLKHFLGRMILKFFGIHCYNHFVYIKHWQSLHTAQASHFLCHNLMKYTT